MSERGGREPVSERGKRAERTEPGDREPVSERASGAEPAIESEPVGECGERGDREPVFEGGDRGDREPVFEGGDREPGSNAGWPRAGFERASGVEPASVRSDRGDPEPGFERSDRGDARRWSSAATASRGFERGDRTGASRWSSAPAAWEPTTEREPVPAVVPRRRRHVEVGHGR